jgi:glycosyltransferase involved in cell wall biosynthesis
MRIALVYRSFHLAASLARGTVELARHLSQGHEVHVFSIDERTDAALAPRCTFHNVHVSHLGDGTRFSARELLAFARRVESLLARERFDVVHVCAPSAWVGEVLLVPGIVRGEARLQGIHDLRLIATTVRHPGNAARLFLEKRAFRNPSLRRIHVAAPSVRNDVIASYGVDPDDVLLVPPAVNLTEFSPAPDRAAARIEAGLESAGIVIVFCGSSFWRKGLDRAIEALALVGGDVELVVVGRGHDEEWYRELARARGIENRVRFLGQRSDAWRLYHAADMFVLPTRADVWGLTVIEAMACGVPPIVSSAAGSSSAIRSGETGIVLPEPFRLEDFVDAIELLKRDEELRLAMGRAGTEVAKEHSWAKLARVIEQDLVAVAEGRLGRPLARERRR